MDRRYYLAKLGIIVVAVALAVAGTGIGTTRAAHSFGANTRYAAAAQVEAAAWHVTAAMGHLIKHLLFTTGQIPG
ncbi:MAG TPA: hypothetical protein VL286_03855 [Rhizomicrobium sp.]|nr:hypothetical protein [Rhizomicrobium sp.]